MSRDSGRKRGGPPRGPRTPGLGPIAQKSRLQLDRPAEDALDPAELEEIKGHLAFLQRFKAALRLSLNAAEDLLVNGAKAPNERGVIKHLLTKVDRAAVEQALAREPLKSQAGLRAGFLGGIVRLQPTPDNLLSYLEALGEADRREAAQAFHMTVRRIDFGALNPTQLARVLEILLRTFSGGDRVQVAIGLLSSESAHTLLESASLDGESKALFRPLSAVHHVVVRGSPLPNDESERALVARGLQVWLESPDPVLRSYPLPVRVRLLELALAGVDGARPKKVPRGLLDSIPHADPAYARLGQLWAERLLADGDDAAARSVLNGLLAAHPYLKGVAAWRDALSWRQVGRVCFDDRQTLGAGMTRAFWLDGKRFGWARSGTVSDAARFAAEAKMQADLLLPGVPPSSAHGLAKDGSPWLFVSCPGRPLAQALAARLAGNDALALALDAVLVLKALAAAGIELPDADPGRFLIQGRPARLFLVDMNGALASEANRAAMGHARLAHQLAKRLLEPFLSERGEDTVVSDELRRRLSSPSPLPLLIKALYDATSA